MKQPLRVRERVVLEVMSKPKTPSEIRKQIGLTRDSNLSSTLKGLVNLGLVHCLNPKAGLGKLYGLTKKGLTARKREGYKEYHHPTGIDWNLYGWVVCGKQRRAILRAMSADILLPLKAIKERAQGQNPRISRTNANDILQLFVKKRIAGKIKQGNRVSFGLTKIGRRIRNQLMNC